MMRKILSISIMFLIIGCAPLFPPPVLPAWTAIPTYTPNIYTPTPLILAPPTNLITATITPDLLTNSVTAEVSSLTPTTQFFSSATFTETAAQSINVDILGCNTSLDVRNGMGEVTNAYVTVKNTGGADIPNTCAILRAIDEGREHPDKRVCISNLPIQSQITYKLTVDSTFKKDTIIQVDVTSNENILLRIDKQSCRDISLFGGIPGDTGVIKPIIP